MRIALVSDAWAPQVNGVVRTLATTMEQLHNRGHAVRAFTPDMFRNWPCPGYGEIRLALGSGRALGAALDDYAPDAIHIATEGPLGWGARRWCHSRRMPYTTSFHTRFPEYVALRTGLPARWLWPPLKRFHASAGAILVATPTLAAELESHGLHQNRLWSRGVDLTLFDGKTRPHPGIAALPAPVQLYVGRVAIEKNLAAFLETDVPGTKVVVGDGPARAALNARYPDAVFMGALHGEALASAYAAADVFVFPSRTDTFGLVIIEALASGVPVAAYPVPGPIDIIGKDGLGAQGDAAGPIGALDERLDMAIMSALACEPEACRRHAQRFSWDASTDQFLSALIDVKSVLAARRIWSRRRRPPARPIAPLPNGPTAAPPAESSVRPT